MHEFNHLSLDVSLAAFGRKEIEIAEVDMAFIMLLPISDRLCLLFQNEMPGLMYLRKKVGFFVPAKVIDG